MRRRPSRWALGWMLRRSRFARGLVNFAEGAGGSLCAPAAVAVGVGLDVAVDAIRGGLDQFRGVDRRFQLRGRVGGVSVIDDYGHHPTEIKATLAAARSGGFRKIHVVFQPHRYTRTRD